MSGLSGAGLAKKSVPGAVATGSQRSIPIEMAGTNPVATAPGTDLIYTDLIYNCAIISAGVQYAQRFCILPS